MVPSSIRPRARGEGIFRNQHDHAVPLERLHAHSARAYQIYGTEGPQRIFILRYADENCRTQTALLALDQRSPFGAPRCMCRIVLRVHVAHYIQNEVVRGDESRSFDYCRMYPSETFETSQLAGFDLQIYACDNDVRRVRISLSSRV